MHLEGEATQVPKLQKEVLIVLIVEDRGNCFF
jgi:hypothetical protein